ncbi:hypothetical protein FNF27_07057 [Cafeteria roenbergensis]|uniref:Uncharacterized protein n=2 Tax=Cafeteria roenbergensis TaxID=33653 RepID=A0A5A8C2Y5_CAFRO|nr:hypothetical protein FNF31_07776 [Cafeteria roenbergensis]KAA0166687.1 hypothetical protein FNF28_03061 [Cafeteria roenbergensis]KAA0169105.1 hypothetical protein FNF27_07057 [Cafeteria roenbergensis]
MDGLSAFTPKSMSGEQVALLAGFGLAAAGGFGAWYWLSNRKGGFAASAGSVSEDTLIAVLEEVTEAADEPLAAFAEKAEAMFGDVMRQRARPEDMQLQALIVWQAEMSRITARACAAHGTFKQEEFTQALKYFSPRSERVAELEAEVLETRPKVSFTLADCERIEAAAEEALVQVLRSRVETLEARGAAPGSEELSRRIGLEFAKLREQSVQAALEDDGPGTSVAGPFYQIYLRVHGLAAWPREREFLLRMTGTFKELGLGLAAESIARQVAARDAQARAQRMQQGMRRPGMGGMGMGM